MTVSSKLWTGAKIIAAAGLCGIGVVCFVLPQTGNGFMEGEPPINRLMLTIGAPILSAILAYRGNANQLTIRHTFDTHQGRDIAMQTFNRMV